MLLEEHLHVYLLWTYVDEARKVSLADVVQH